MSALLRQWRGASMETPAVGLGGMSAVALAESLTADEAKALIDFVRAVSSEER